MWELLIIHPDTGQLHPIAVGEREAVHEAKRALERLNCEAAAAGAEWVTARQLEQERLH